jgi:hypothetical protein
MKQYAILSKTDHSPVIVSTNSHDYPELLSIGYSVLFSGNKKDCERMIESEIELSY